MSVTILNITGNCEDFEDDLCIELRKQVHSPCKVVCARGYGLVVNHQLRASASDILVVVAHGEDIGGQTEIDAGWGEYLAAVEHDESFVREPERVKEWVRAGNKLAASQLNTPEWLADILAQNPTNPAGKVIIMYVCHAALANTIGSSGKIPSLIGIIATPDSPSESDVNLVAEMVNGMQKCLDEGLTDNTTLTGLVNDLVAQHGGSPAFRYWPAMPVAEDAQAEAESGETCWAERDAQGNITKISLRSSKPRSP